MPVSPNTKVLAAKRSDDIGYGALQGWFRLTKEASRTRQNDCNNCGDGKGEMTPAKIVDQRRGTPIASELRNPLLRRRC